MLDIKEVEKQLASVGYKTPIWQRAEVRELCNALSPEEVIVQACNGHYEGGFGLLVATNHRLLLIDRKPMFLTLDAISYGMIQEISLNYRLLNSTIHIWTSNKCLDFSSMSHGRVRSVLDYAQKSILEARTGYKTSDKPAVEAPVIHAVVPPTPGPGIDYRGFFKTTKNPEQVIVQQPTVGSFPISPSDLSVSKKSVYRMSPLSGRVFARHYY